MKFDTFLTLITLFGIFVTCRDTSAPAPTKNYEPDNVWCDFNGVNEQNLGVVRTILESHQIQYSRALGYQFMCLYNFRFPMFQHSDIGRCDRCLFLVNPKLALHEDSVLAYIENQKMVLYEGGSDVFTESTLEHCNCSEDKLIRSVKDYAWYLHEIE